MATVGEHEITEEQIRSYVLRNQEDALTYPVLQAIAYDYLNKVIRKAQKFDKWPKDIREICYSQGIRQDKETGLPIYDGAGVTAWSARARVAEERALQQAAVVNHMVEAIIKAVKEIESEPSPTDGGEYCDSLSCDHFLETIKGLI